VADPLFSAKRFAHARSRARDELTLRGSKQTSCRRNRRSTNEHRDRPVRRRLHGPVGLAAGFDKNARVFRRMYAQGFSFVEIGGVTPLRRRQSAPRSFACRKTRDHQQHGLSNDGAEAVVRRLGGERPAGMLASTSRQRRQCRPAEDFAGLVQRFSNYATT